MLSDDEKKKLNNRLRRVIGQVEAVGRMIEDEEYCVDILMQLSAATGALNKVGQIILEQHIRTCVSDAIKSGNAKDRDEKIEELMTVFRKYGE
ncbi:metal-sensitive transcriptional regulator [Rhodopirellula sp. P2]|jgi:DNA-binding FrmR family transcriptional regulator|uniref:metal-sensitive transcriptional regulator n=1 Tax=Rhodopirellula sp. P2 TaxID=2127060 RepID=UPI002367B7C9|nr:metal-sensitive transcriptional regulator [Rhodopirellula sp. P2]WDQ17049.1 metal-sensitive transcriptional regulator [Rhodopirellula sp. P2]